MPDDMSAPELPSDEQMATAVKDWAENHFDEVRHARERYDAESADA